MSRDTETPRPEICVNVITMIKCLLPGTATTNTSETGSVIPRSTALLLAVFIALSRRPVSATFALALGPTGGSRSSWTDGLFVGGRDDFFREVQPGRTR